MIWIILIVGAVALYIIIKMVQSSYPRGFAKQLAKSLLLIFFAARRANPNTPARELYIMAVETRPGYDNRLAIALVDAAEFVAREEGVEFRFWLVVLQLASYEYRTRTGSAAGSLMVEIQEGVLDAIPQNI